jgi:hypothetical protein
MTMDLIHICQKAQFIPSPLTRCKEIFKHIESKDLASILHSIFSFFLDFTPSVGHFLPNEDNPLFFTRIYKSYKIAPYLSSTLKTITKHISKIGNYFPVIMVEN